MGSHSHTTRFWVTEVADAKTLELLRQLRRCALVRADFALDYPGATSPCYAPAMRYELPTGDHAAAIDAILDTLHDRDGVYFES